MVARRQAVQPTPGGLDQGAVMLALAAREQALQVMPAEGVRLASAGESGRQFLINDAPVGARSFGAMCDFVDVPASFLKRAPLDLAGDVVQRMLKEPRVCERELVINTATNAVVGHRPKGTEMLPASRVFERLFDAAPETDGIYLHESDAAVEASVVCRSLDIEPKKGDVVRGGLTCLYSEIDVKKSYLRAYSERLICTNGMTHREFDRDFGVFDDADAFLEEIGSSVVACLDYVGRALQPKMARAAEFEVNGPQAIRRIFRASRLPAKYLDAVLAAHAIEDDGTAYGVLQAFTRAANALKHEARMKLQSVAGGELTVIEAAHCPACYSPL